MGVSRVSGKVKNRKDRAVSPVIGVMLMLVVTVLLAAAVSAFTGGLKAQKPAPSAQFRVKIFKNTTVNMGTTSFKCSYIEITETSGDSIPTKDLEIITYNPDAYGPHKMMVVKPDSMNTHCEYTYTWKGKTYTAWANGTSPYLNNYVYGYLNSSNPKNFKTWFGNYTVHPGVTMTADWYSNFAQAKWNASTGWYVTNHTVDPNAGNVTGFCACIADGWNVTPGHYITVEIVYTPTHTVIWKSKVLVEGEGV